MYESTHAKLVHLGMSHLVAEDRVKRYKEEQEPLKREADKAVHQAGLLEGVTLRQADLVK